MSKRALRTLLAAAALVVVAGFFWSRSAVLIGVPVGLLFSYAFVAQNAEFRYMGYGDGPSGTVRMPAAFMAVGTGLAAVVAILGAAGRPVDTALGVIPFVLLAGLAPRVLTPDPPPR